MTEPTATVPDVYQGLWRRRVIETPEGVDRDTSVYWLQTGRLYADIRIPVRHRRRLWPMRLTDADFLQLAQQQGFAGELEVEDDVLRWQRWLDFQPGGALDIGRVHFEGDVLVEEGVTLPYREEWERLAVTGEDRLALSLEVEYYSNGCPLKRAGVLVAIDGYFMLAIGRRAALPAASELSDLMDSRRYSHEARRGFLDCAIEFGLRHADGRWEVRLSTLPHHEGLGFDRLTGLWQPDGPDHYHQASPSGTHRRWRIIEQGEAFGGLAMTR
jgi:hypothetical protein